MISDCMVEWKKTSFGFTKAGLWVTNSLAGLLVPLRQGIGFPICETGMYLKLAHDSKSSLSHLLALLKRIAGPHFCSLWEVQGDSNSTQVFARVSLAHTSVCGTHGIAFKQYKQDRWTANYPFTNLDWCKDGSWWINISPFYITMLGR